jgi:protoporphyrinogen IX oxidase
MQLILALHIIFIVTWFAALFYIVRLFIYHAEAEKKSEPDKTILQNQFKIMEKRLWYGIGWPSLILTYILGPLLAYRMFDLYFPQWLILKLVFVFALTLYHIRCHIMFTHFQKNIVKHSSMKLRLWNEVATLFLVAIVFIVVYKNQDMHNYLMGALGITLFAIMMVIAVNMYKKSRTKHDKED